MKEYKYIEIPVVTNSGRTGKITCSKFGEGPTARRVMLEGLSQYVPYSSIEEGYIHLQNIDYSEEQQEEIRQICIDDFADIKIEKGFCGVKSIQVVNRNRGLGERIKIWWKNVRGGDVFSSVFGRTLKDFIKAFLHFPRREEYKSIDAVVPSGFNCFLGGSFQRFFEDSKWLQESEKRKGSRIFLA